ncbi:Type II secretory pathway ATPase GspE/PulE or T4P pilus assembly pathway ATPase PilB [Azospirillum oryzae]|uniref:Type II secretory pathway ATPase GspE/PulE or T4P pilus assembly pathway ATPase PilB n=1 Tax=Azospirillum oryzae TaxID=286727 RepID=A0A1X7ESZ8_9PROT|nr:ATPase, T2SS/T4P/T4SS family [Azospirillum oryzae]SMF39686.1 Type II secretory pathway ATPase GspE/PulE or T4P pilus assembly pathway ATPase PilB [Azospirillum oryzae]
MSGIDQKTVQGFERVAAVEVAAAAAEGREISHQAVMSQNLFLSMMDEDPRGRRNASGETLRSMVPYSAFGEHSLIPSELTNGVLVVGATADHDPAAVDNLSYAVQAAGFEVESVTVETLAQQDVEEALSSFRPPSPERIGELAAHFARDPENGGDALLQLLEDVWTEALDLGASDIDFMFLPETTKNWIAFHVNGERDLRHNLPSVTMGALVSLVKRQAKCQDYSVRERIQSGRLSISWQGRLIDARVGTGPVEPDGEEVSVRLLDLAKVPRFRVLTRHMPDVGEALLALIQAPVKASGLVIISGPTAQGKTTSLASIEGAYDRVRRKIIEISRPPEYLVPYVLAEDAKGREGRKVADHIAGALRRAPDVLVVQEVLTEEDGDASAQAVDSGHLTYLTLHAGDAPQTVQRYIERLGQDNQRVAHAIVGEHLRVVVNQRLVRTVCHVCREDAGPVHKHFASVDLQRLKLKRATPVFRQSKTGCRYCRHTGVSGRALAAETMILPREPEFKQKIIQLIQEQRYDEIPLSDGVKFTPRVERVGQLLAEGLLCVETAADLMAVR